MPEVYRPAAPELTANVVMVVTNDSEERHEVTGKVGFPYFGRLIEDTLNGTDLAMPQAHTLMAAEVSLARRPSLTLARIKNKRRRSRLSGPVYQRVMQN